MTYQYIDFYMSPNPFGEEYIYYIVDYQEGKKSMLYSKFKNFLKENFKIENLKSLFYDLDSHCIIHLDNKTGKHFSKTLCESQIMNSKGSKTDFEILYDLNEKEKQNTDYINFKENLYKRLSNWGWTGKKRCLNEFFKTI